MTSTVELITPEIAQELIGNNDGNRPLSHARIALYAAEIEADTWKLNGQGISIDTAGRLLDGQHRMHAIIKANKSVKMLVSRHVDPTTFDTFDIGKGRTAKDVLEISGLSYTSEQSTLVAKILNWESGTSIKNHLNLEKKVKVKYRPAAVLEYCKLHDLTPHCRFGQEVYLKNKQLLDKSEWIFYSWLFGGISEHEAKRFLTLLSTGGGLADNSPIFILREKLIKESFKKSILPIQRQNIIIKAWNSYRKNELITELRALTTENIKPI